MPLLSAGLLAALTFSDAPVMTPDASSRRTHTAGRSCAFIALNARRFGVLASKCVVISICLRLCVTLSARRQHRLC